MVDEYGQEPLPLPFLCPVCGRALSNRGEWCCGAPEDEVLEVV